MPMMFLKKIFQVMVLSCLGCFSIKTTQAQVAPVQNQFYLNPYI